MTTTQLNVYSKNTLEKVRKDIVYTIISQAVNAVTPSCFIPANISFKNNTIYCCDERFMIKETTRIVVIGFGKVSVGMATELERILGERITGGVIITNQVSDQKLKKISILSGDHPLIGGNTIASSEKLLSEISGLTENDIVVCLISGGGSAMFEILPEGISFEEFRELNRMLLLSGAAIEEINSVRQAISLVKGGKLLQYIFPARCVSLILSDVIGNPIEFIASGPTCLQESSAKTALKVMEKYNLIGKVAPRIKEYVFSNSELSNAGSTMVADYYKNAVRNLILANNKKAIEAAVLYCKSIGFDTMIFSDEVHGEAREVAKTFAQIIKDTHGKNFNRKNPVCILAGGETTVTVTGNGLGGRNQELVLATLVELRDTKVDFFFASCGTDGVDGMTNVAGGIVSKDSIEQLQKLHILPETFLQNNDSFHLLEAIDGLLQIPKNTTNVMDLMIALVY